MQQTVSELSALAGEKQVRLSLTGSEVTVEGNRLLLGRVFFNLVENAIKYNRPGGSVDITVSDTPAVTVADTGIGIPPEALDADVIFAGFWTDKGTCAQDMAGFLPLCGGKKVALFGTAGFGGDPDYFNMLLENVKKLLPSDAVYLGGWMCQGRMPGSVRARFAAQLEQDPENANAKRMLENFDRALSHPDEADLAAAAFFSNGKLAGDTAAAESL